MLRDTTTGDILNYEYLYNIHEYKTNEELMSAVVNFGFEICASLIVDSNQITVVTFQRTAWRGQSGSFTVYRIKYKICR